MTKSEQQNREETVKKYLVKELTARKDELEDVSYIEHHVLKSLNRVGFYISDSVVELPKINNPSLTALYAFGYKISYDLLSSLGVTLDKDESFINSMKIYADELYNKFYSELFPEGE